MSGPHLDCVVRLVSPRQISTWCCLGKSAKEGVNPLFFADKLHRPAVSRRRSLRCNISGSFWPKCTRFWYDQNEVLRRVLLGPILRKRGVNPLFFADKLHRTAVSRRSSLRGNSLSSFWPNCTSFWYDQNEVLRLVLLNPNLRKGGVNPLFFADKLHRATV